jgi:L-lactate dehydrogenase complex protein LldG
VNELASPPEGHSTAREDVLGRIRTALGETRAPAPEVVRDYRGVGGHPVTGTALLDLLVDRVEDYRATVLRCAPAEVGATVRAALDQALGAGWAGADVVVAPGLDAAWRPEGCDVDDDRAAVQLADRAASVTAVAVAIAETGTLVLDGSPACGRRALSLLPDVLVCVVTADQVVGGVPEGLARLDPLRPLTMVSGPSATSDIELQRVEGVHGPRTLMVVLAD